VLTHSLTLGVSFFGLLGIAGIYARQAEKVGGLGLAGFLMVSLWLVLVPGFTFFEAMILAVVAVDAPNVAEAMEGLTNAAARRSRVAFRALSNGSHTNGRSRASLRNGAAS
jgi:hypothetical protein